MTPAQWTRLDELYAEASALAPGARGALVGRVRAQDAELAAELISLLDADDRAGEFLNVPAVNVGAITAVDAGAADPMVGRTLGDFTIEQRLGAGGMGVVYLARQQSPGRAVALKVVRPDAMSPGVLRRFRHEADVLARLQHPGIAQVYEFGQAQTPMGPRPYFAMELVEGKPLLRFAQEAGLGTRERLDLFARICDAVQYAHQRGVIHRDLKPGNILVPDDPASTGTRRPDAPGAQPKVLDFGVARLTDSDLRLTTLQTDVGQLLGTIPYMSPEQAGGNAQDLDVRSDVYALGVILYELLAGKLPYDLGGKPVAEAVRVITETDPTRLSNISRRFRGDVETIVAKALEKDRARRYQSAGELAEDVRRYLADRAILARPPSTAYQLRKFARRNRALVGGVVAAFILLAGGVVGTSAGLVRARDAEKRALDTAARAQRTSKYLRDTIGWFKPGRTQSPTVSLKDVLDSVSARIEKELADQPDVAAFMHTTVATNYLSLADFDKADHHAARAIECWSAAGEEAGEGVTEALGVQLEVAAGRGNLAGAQSIAERIIEIHLRTLPESHPLVAKASLALARVLRGQKKVDEAERVLSRALADLKAAGSQPQSVIEGNNELAMLIRRKQPERAIALMREAIELSRSTPGMDAESTAILMNNLATALKNRGELEESERVYEESVELRRSIYGDEHASVALAVNNLGTIQLKRGKVAEAEASFRKALEMRRRLLGPEHRSTINSLENLAQTRRDRGDLPAAETHFREAWELRTKIDGPDHPEAAICEGRLAAAISQQQRYDEAEPLFREAERRLLASSARDVIDLQFLRIDFAQMLGAKGRHAEAEAIYREVLGWYRANAPDSVTDVASANAALARTLRTLGRPAEAEAPARLAVDTISGSTVASSPVLNAYRQTLAGIWNDLGRHAEAETVLREVVAVHGAGDPVPLLRLASSKSELAVSLMGQRGFEESEKYLLEALDHIGASSEKDPTALASVRARLVRLYEAWNKPEFAAKYRDAPSGP